MITSIKIQVLGNNLACDGVSITRASVRAYTDALESALSDKYPSADIVIDTQWNAGGSARGVEVFSDGDFDIDGTGTVEDAETETHDSLMRAQEEERRAVEAIAEIQGQVWEQWAISAAVAS